MSHVATVETVIYHLDLLSQAVEELGLKFNWGQTNHKWYGRWMNDYAADDAAYRQGIDPSQYGKCDHAISMPGNTSAYEIGVVKNPKGDGHVLLFDFYNNGYGMGSVVGGGNMGKLVARYNRLVEIQKAQQLGYGVQETVNDQGQIELEFIDYGYQQEAQQWA